MPLIISSDASTSVQTETPVHAKLQSDQHQCFYRPDALPITHPTSVKALKLYCLLPMRVTVCSAAYNCLLDLLCSILALQHTFWLSVFV